MLYPSVSLALEYVSHKLSSCAVMFVSDWPAASKAALVGANRVMSVTLSVIMSRGDASAREPADEARPLCTRTVVPLAGRERMVSTMWITPPEKAMSCVETSEVRA